MKQQNVCLGVTAWLLLLMESLIKGVSSIFLALFLTALHLLVIIPHTVYIDALFLYLEPFSHHDPAFHFKILLFILLYNGTLCIFSFICVVQRKGST